MNFQFIKFLVLTTRIQKHHQQSKINMKKNQLMKHHDKYVYHQIKNIDVVNANKSYRQ